MIPLVPSSTTPSTSHVSHSFMSSSLSSHDWCSSADTQIRIGLSILQDLADGMDSSDKGVDQEDEIQQRLRYSRLVLESPVS